MGKQGCRAITISGEIASGKSTIGVLLAKKLGWERINTGDRFRAFLADKGKSVQEVSFLSDEVHKEFDSSQQQLAKEGNNIVIEGRLSGWLSKEMDDVFRVYCFAPIEVRAKRYMGREHVSVDEAIEEINFRDTKDLLKYRNMYGVNDYRESIFYNLVVDTSSFTPEEAVDFILAKVFGGCEMEKI